jgi:hypothetical protein
VNQTPRTSVPPEPQDSSTNPDPTKEPVETKCFSDDVKLGRLLWPEPWASQATVQADNIGRVRDSRLVTLSRLHIREESLIQSIIC